MKKDRIQIDGIWYVREDNQTPIPQIPEKELTWFEGVVYENSDYCWKVTTIKRDEEGFYNGIDIEFINKKDGGPSELWDNDYWMIRVYEGEPEALVEAHKSMDPEGVATFKAIVKILLEKEWLKK